MNRTADMADLFSGFMSEARHSESERDVSKEWRFVCDMHQSVSDNLGVYFLFCLFGLAILALFLCRSMQALQTSLSFFVFHGQVLAGFYVSINFYRRGTLDFK